ncbi:hypothetical protein AJ79_06324 [Helicocarpus griseus UAMH5409]|uniref:Uncharacterized protein n=1 Tax=Helicocarpus griseus UAMH5409 TaxID=1447875 RepID=A0A2B7XE86_9EURO|nr:hypothetical protein AJ79_06324 [Helicocarpus griseus UAMH5409]
MDSTKIALSVFTAFGALALLFLLLRALRHISTFLHPSTLPKYLNKSKGSYALVTGSTDGIGTGFARELCKHRFNLILHGRNPAKLSRTKAELSREFPDLKFLPFTFDASKPTDSLENAVREQLGADIPITVLVNNVGGLGGQTHAQFMALKDHLNDEVDRIINVNLRFMTQLSRVLLPVLERNSPALIMNVSSVSHIGMPYLAIYAATKAYIQSFTNGLNMEMRAEGNNVDVMSVEIASVQTPGNPLGHGFFVPTPDKIASSSLARVGCGSVSVVPYWRHWLQKMTIDVIPESLVKRLVVYNVKLLKTEWKRREEEQRSTDDLRNEITGEERGESRKEA